MPPRKEYTVTGNDGSRIGKGDTVTVAFEGVVRDVTRDGYLILKTANGTFAHFDPSYQVVLKSEKPKTTK